MERYKQYRKEHHIKASLIEIAVTVVIVAAILGLGFGLQSTAGAVVAGTVNGVAYGILALGIVHVVKAIYTAKTGKDLSEELDKKAAEEAKHNKKVEEKTKREEEEYDDGL